VERAAALLRAVARATGPAATATALAQAVGLNRTTTWRLLTTLEDQRLVNLDRTTGWYSLGFGLVDLAGQASGVTMVRSSKAVLRRMAARTGETTALSVMRDGRLVYVAEETPNAAFLAGWLGTEASMHGTATGKAMLAFSDPAELSGLMQLPRGGRLPRLTSSTITSRTALLDDLERTRVRGFSVSRGESMESAWGVAAPVLDLAGRPVAIVTLWGPPERVTEERLTELGALVVAGTAEIAGRA
jgi:DNA-binding IclR family transcriptional regulator